MKTQFGIFNILSSVMLVLGLLLGGCGKDDPPPPINEGELITTLTVVLVDSSNIENMVSASFRDVDGPGGNAPTVDAIVLQANKTYWCTIMVLDESKNPAVDIGEEILEEAEDHQFYFQAQGVNVAVTYRDADQVGLPLGIETAWSTGVASNGTVTITLKHKPGIKAAGDPITVGDTDIEVTFAVTVL